MRRNKKVLLGSIAALAVLAIGTGAVSTFAWYAASAAPGVVSNASSGGTLASTSTTLDVDNTFTINLAIARANNDDTVELSHLGDGTTVGGVTYESGKLYRGVHLAANDNRVEEVTTTTDTNCIKAFTITASWASAPSAAADLAYFGTERTITGFELVEGSNTQICDTDDYTGKSGSWTDAAALTFSVKVQYSNSNWVWTVVNSHSYYRIEPAQLNSSETGTAGSISVTAYGAGELSMS